MTIKVHGDARIQQIFKNVTPKHAKSLARTTVHAVAGDVRNEIRRQTDSSNIAKGTRTKRRRMIGSYAASRVNIHVRYWRFEEYGHLGFRVWNSPKRFVLRSVERIRPNMPAYFRKHFWNKLRAQIQRQLR